MAVKGEVSKKIQSKQAKSIKKKDNVVKQHRKTSEVYRQFEKL